MFPTRYPAMNAQRVQVANRARNVSGSIYLVFVSVVRVIPFDVQTLLHFLKDEKKIIREVRK